LIAAVMSWHNTMRVADRVQYEGFPLTAKFTSNVMTKSIEISAPSLKKKFESISNLSFNPPTNVSIGFVAFGGGGVPAFALPKSLDARAMIDRARVDMFSAF
jgi:hypothetical protein